MQVNTYNFHICRKFLFIFRAVPYTVRLLFDFVAHTWRAHVCVNFTICNIPYLGFINTNQHYFSWLCGPRLADFQHYAHSLPSYHQIGQSAYFQQAFHQFLAPSIFPAFVAPKCASCAFPSKRSSKLTFSVHRPQTKNSCSFKILLFFKRLGYSGERE